MHAWSEINYASPLIAPFPVVFRKHFFSIFSAQFAVLEQNLDGCPRQAFFDIDLSFAEMDKAFRVSSPLPVFALESIM
jgi:hypothetical protein